MQRGPRLAGPSGPAIILSVVAAATVLASALGEEVRFHGKLESGHPADGRHKVIRKEVDSLGGVHELLVPASLVQSQGGSHTIHHNHLGHDEQGNHNVDDDKRSSPSPGVKLNPYNVPHSIIGPPGPRGPPGSKGMPGKHGAVGSTGKKGESGPSSDTEVAKALEDHEPHATMLNLVCLVISNFVMVGACHFFASTRLIKPADQGTHAGINEDFDDDADLDGDKYIDGEGPQDGISGDEYAGAERHEAEEARLT